MEIEVIVFPKEVFQFFKCHQNEAKHDKRDFKRGLAVVLEVKISYYYWEDRFKTLQAYFICG